VRPGRVRTGAATLAAGRHPEPAGRLTTTARNRAVNRLRREAVGAAKLYEAAVISHPAEPDEVLDVPGDRLRLMFTCCYPALVLEAQVAPTLRTLAGLTTAEIARTFLVGESTMSKRLVRVKQKIRNAGIPYRIPPAHLLPERTTAVRGVLYLLFSEGYSATAGTDLIRQGLCAEGMRLARQLTRLMPDEPEASGLLALMLLHDARRATRVDGDGDLVTLEHQGRARFAGGIAEGVALLESAVRRGRPGDYQVQAAIAACHATAATAGDTDWPQIAGLYGQLVRLVPSPVVELNRAVAVGMAEGPEAGLALVDALAASGALAGYHLLPAPGPTCSAGWTVLARPRPPTAKHSTWPPPTRSATTWPGAWRRSQLDLSIRGWRVRRLSEDTDPEGEQPWTRQLRPTAPPSRSTGQVMALRSSSWRAPSATGPPARRWPRCWPSGSPCSPTTGEDEATARTPRRTRSSARSRISPR
jgi:RNA polymerase sigma-70 factor (ECF subfamily)